MSVIANHLFSSLLNSHPVLLISSRSGRANTIAPLIWYSPLSCDPPLIGISLKPSTQSFQYIREAGDFILGIPGGDLIKTTHFCALHSGKDLDKLFHLNLPTQRGKAVSPLFISTCLANIECRVRDIYITGNRPFISGEVLSVYVDDNHYRNGWLPSATFIHYISGNLYRIGDEIVDMSSMRPGYVPPNSIV
ncbi:MAG: flavin reductase family protein [bacterium]|jgi:flavin reductase (DIM6/NTAB) family NADH-FMN oxidoreductase RutF